MRAEESGALAYEGAISAVLLGIAIGGGFAIFAMRCYQHGRLCGADEICEYVAAYRHGVRAARGAARPHVAHEAPHG